MYAHPLAAFQNVKRFKHLGDDPSTSIPVPADPGVIDPTGMTPVSMSQTDIDNAVAQSASFIAQLRTLLPQANQILEQLNFYNYALNNADPNDFDMICNIKSKIAQSKQSCKDTLDQLYPVYDAINTFSAQLAPYSQNFPNVAITYDDMATIVNTQSGDPNMNIDYSLDANLPTASEGNSTSTDPNAQIDTSYQVENFNATPAQVAITQAAQTAGVQPVDSQTVQASITPIPQAVHPLVPIGIGIGIIYLLSK